MFIAEIGINHNGNLELAKELILMAKRSGADVVKFQKRNVDENILEQDRGTLRKTLDGYIPYEDYKNMLEFDAFQYAEINRFCKDIGIQWTASVWDIPSVEFLSNFDVPFIKIPSARLNELDLLHAINKTNMPVILSIGMSSYHEVAKAIDTLKNIIVVMHCKSVYPPNDEDLNLNVIPHLKLKYPEYKIGYSSHDTSIYPSICASSLGAEVFEAHITLNKNMYGSDQKCSFEE
jgi:N-acetylneuraminate synthase